MAKFDKLAVMAKIGETGMVPVFYNQDLDLCKNVVRACYEGGVRAFEFTNRGDFAHEIFGELVNGRRKSVPNSRSVSVLLWTLPRQHCISNSVPALW